MTVRRRHAALALVVGLMAGVTSRGLAQAVSVSLAVVNDSISPAPQVLVQGTPGPPSLAPYSVTLELALEPLFRAPFLVRSSSDLAASFQVDSLLPERTVVFFRARIFDRLGNAQEQVRSFPVRSWVRLVSPTRSVNDVLFTRQPTFTWSSPGVTLPPGPWTYEITITNTANGQITQFTANDTTFVPPAPLEACTSYRWSLHARMVNGPASDQTTANSPGTFVIQTKECPTATLFYQNFPNPFGGGLQPNTCFWFDLAHRANVSLNVYDLRGRRVRTIVPGLLPAQLDSGAYGRQGGTEGGCDTKTQWDGRDAAGRNVPPGVYIAIFTADGLRSTIKILYRGP
ncbi:MAG TPA: hypothetical protein VGH04_10895 [Gemmatimonadaceae bacterium]|jgi:hypothetical protein